MRAAEGAARLGAIEAGDVLLVRGEPEAVAALASELALSLRDDVDAGPVEASVFNRASGLAEVVIPPRSPLVGDRLYPRHGDAERRPRGARRAAAGRGSRRRASR